MLQCSRMYLKAEFEDGKFLVACFVKCRGAPCGDACVGIMKVENSVHIEFRTFRKSRQQRQFLTLKQTLSTNLELILLAKYDKRYGKTFCRQPK